MSIESKGGSPTHETARETRKTSPKSPDRKSSGGPEKRTRRDDLTSDEGKELWDAEKKIDEDIWLKETVDRIEKKKKILEGGPKEDDKKMTPQEAEFVKLQTEYKNISIEQKIKDLKKKMEAPKEKTGIDKEIEDLEKEFKYIETVNKTEALKEKIKETKEKVKDKAKYLDQKLGKTEKSSGGWFNFFKTEKSKNLSAAAVFALGIFAFPLFFVGGMMFLLNSGEKKEGKK